MAKRLGICEDGQRAIIRSDDYYGGDVDVLLEQARREVSIEWDAWGNHGSVAITFDRLECHALAEAFAYFAARLDAAVTR